MTKRFVSDISWPYLFGYLRSEPGKSLFRHYQELVMQDCGASFAGEVVELGGEKHYYAAAYFPNVGSYVVSNIDRDYDLHLDARDMALPDASVDNFVMVSMLQHVDDPFRAMDEVARTLKPGGRLLLVNAFSHPLCDVRDYWRFSADGCLAMMKGRFEIDTVYRLGGKYSAFAHAFQRPRNSRSPRILANKLIGLAVALMGKVLEADDFSPLGIGVLARKKG